MKRQPAEQTLFRSDDVRLRFLHNGVRTNQETKDGSALNECPEEPYG